jgi:CubicO group peptidase (beta-lactamase class C family)
MEPQGFCADGFEAIREAFASNFVAGEEVGASACVVHDREVVDDLGG